MIRSEIEQEITDIWRPLLDPKIHPQEMALLIRQCKDESLALITRSNQELLSRVERELPEKRKTIGAMNQLHRIENITYNQTLNQTKATIDRIRGEL